MVSSYSTCFLFAQLSSLLEFFAFLKLALWLHFLQFFTLIFFHCSLCHHSLWSCYSPSPFYVPFYQPSSVFLLPSLAFDFLFYWFFVFPTLIFFTGSHTFVHLAASFLVLFLFLTFASVPSSPLLAPSAVHANLFRWPQKSLHVMSLAD